LHQSLFLGKIALEEGGAALWGNTEFWILHLQIFKEVLVFLTFYVEANSAVECPVFKK